MHIHINFPLCVMWKWKRLEKGKTWNVYVGNSYIFIHWKFVIFLCTCFYICLSYNFAYSYWREHKIYVFMFHPHKLIWKYWKLLWKMKRKMRLKCCKSEIFLSLHKIYMFWRMCCLYLCRELFFFSFIEYWRNFNILGLWEKIQRLGNLVTIPSSRISWGFSILNLFLNYLIGLFMKKKQMFFIKQTFTRFVTQIIK